MDEEVHFHCFGGFAIDYLYGLPRSTSDVDIMSGIIRPHHKKLVELAGKDSDLHHKYRVYLDPVGAIAVVPDGYGQRLTEITPSSFTHLRIFVMEPHDIVLSKVSRDAPHDRADLTYMAKVAQLDTKTLSERYEKEVKPYVVGSISYVDQTLKLWIEMIEEVRRS